MAFDDPTRKRLAKFVGACRGLLVEEFTRQLQLDYGLDPATGRVTEGERSRAVDAKQEETGRILRELMGHYLASGGGDDDKARQKALDRIVREQAFTVLNRLCAIRMAEARGFVVEAVAKGYESKGFQLCVRVSGTAVGEAGDAYRYFLFSLFDECAVDLPVLFDRFSPQARLFPRETVLRKLLEEINHPEIEPLWAEDETIGWIYQYYNDPEERKKMRDPKQGGSAAPRNSRELAVRNQFFTPRYVVQFLTDNTLGRIWYEMTKGETALKDRCQYLVRRPTEVFLKPGEEPPAAAPVESSTAETVVAKPRPARGDDKQIALDLPTPPAQETVEALAASAPVEETESAVPPAGPSQEELLRQPVHIPHRPLKDPRTILMLDPACGSMHFGLYAFDLYEVIYAEAWEKQWAVISGQLAVKEEDWPSTLASGKVSADEVAALLTAAGWATTPEFRPLVVDYPDKVALLKEVPRLIIEHNIHGIDIDARCAQIAGLSLWLRAHRAWQGLGLKPAVRPRIKRSNVVCAEPMPGEKGMLREFVERQFPVQERGVFLGLLATVFEKMELAGEAGALLKIEEEIRGVVKTAREAWVKLKSRPAELFSTAELNAIRKQAELDTVPDLGALTADFWTTAETRLLAALRQYAEQAENGGGFQRRLFAEDAARGFAFIDVCRKRYDVALMNPPFGEFPVGVESHMRRRWGTHANDIYVPFLLWASSRLDHCGRVGAITSRNYLLGRDQRDFRPLILGKGSAFIELFVDLGLRVLDGAEVETGAFVLHASQSVLAAGCCFWDFRREPRESLHSLAALMERHSPICRAHRDFAGMPASDIAYQASHAELSVLSSGPRLDPDVGRVTKGLNSSDDFRFLRLMWEPPEGEKAKRWIYCAKGSDYCWVIPNINMVIDWFRDGELLAAYAAGIGDNIAQARRSSAYYHRPAVTHTYRCDDFSLRALPAGCIFTNAAPVISPTDPSILPDLLALFLTHRYERLLGHISKKGKYDTGRMGYLPAPHRRYGIAETMQWRALVRFLMDYERQLETSAYFLAPELNGDRPFDFDLCVSLLDQFAQLTGERVSNAFIERGAKGFRDRFRVSDHRVEERISYALGCVFGRWDIRAIEKGRSAPDTTDPFAPMPLFPPGRLGGSSWRPDSPCDLPSGYPIAIPSVGILVDDPEHSEDVERRVRAALALMAGDRADDVERETCASLGVRSLREYFRRPASFFGKHQRLYSANRRQAPIYWPLSTAKGSYTLWLYYHRLSDQTLYTCLLEFVEPKLKQVAEDRRRLRSMPARSSAQEKELEELTDLEAELQDFRDELLRLAKFWKPNLNDGVLITAAPLWKLFLHRPWRADLKEVWEKLEAGEYEWAHLALSIWPERVVKASHKDRSFAIAHDLEDDLWEEVEIEKKTKGGKVKKRKVWQPKALTEAQVDAIVAAVKAR